VARCEHCQGRGTVPQDVDDPHPHVEWHLCSACGGGVRKATPRTDGAAVECSTCGARFGGMTRCPWDDTALVPLHDADPTAVAFYALIAPAQDEERTR
jgi:predicted RNA-binding Zn-ribbon protein involved in translation (DUF1610 family)